MRKCISDEFKDLKSPVCNDPLTLICNAFSNLFPDARVDCIQYADLDGEGFGCTDFCEDGSVVINIDYRLSVENAAEILAHELAHAAVGAEHDHDDAWNAAFTAIHVEYNRVQGLLDELSMNGNYAEDE